MCKRVCVCVVSIENDGQITSCQECGNELEQSEKATKMQTIELKTDITVNRKTEK